MATVKWYGAAGNHVSDADLDWVVDTVKVMLVTSTYTPNQDTHDYRDDITNELAASGGYTAGGVALANKSRLYDAGTNEERLDADDITWASLTPSAAFRYGIGYKARGGAASADELLFYVDFVTDQNPGGNDFTVRWASTGVLKLVAS